MPENIIKKRGAKKEREFVISSEQVGAKGAADELCSAARPRCFANRLALTNSISTDKQIADWQEMPRERERELY